MLIKQHKTSPAAVREFSQQAGLQHEAQHFLNEAASISKRDEST
jgi:hypothetical protein